MSISTPPVLTPSQSVPADPMLRTAFHAAFWLRDQAAEDHVALPPVKLQALMFLAQVWFAARHKERPLMPAAFVADERGPIEPNVDVVLEAGWDGGGSRESVATVAEALLDEVWRRYGGMPVADLVARTVGLPGYPPRPRQSGMTVIAIPPIARALADAVRSQATAAAPKRLRTQAGRLVVVRPWMPQDASTEFTGAGKG